MALQDLALNLVLTSRENTSYQSLVEEKKSLLI